MLNYKAIEIFTNEDARYRGKPIADVVIAYIRDLKIAARCIVTRGIAGSYESGEISTGRVEILSFNLPIRIYIACRQRRPIGSWRVWTPWSATALSRSTISPWSAIRRPVPSFPGN